MKVIKTIIISGLKLLNIRYAPIHLAISKDRMTEIKRLIPGESPTVVDGGAHKGEFIQLIHRQYSEPVIYGYEPIPELANSLKNKFLKSDKITIREVALGAIQEIIDLNITKILPGTSILEPDEAYSKKYLDGELYAMEKISVQQVRLDREINNIDILKLDLQGYELEALKGSAGILSRIKLILVEVEFIPAYKDQPLFAEVDMFLRENGFKLLNFFDLYTHSDGQLTSGDAIYLNNNFFD